VIAIDGMPGAGKTTALHRLQDALPNQVVVFPEAQPPDDLIPDAATARYLLTEAQGRLADARRLQQAHPGLLVLSDRCHIGVLAYRYALQATGQGPHQDFDRALELAHYFGLTTPHAHDRVLVLLVDPAESVARRLAYAHDDRYRLWFDPDFLDAYHHFLTHLDTWLPPDSFTTHDATTGSAWAALLSALPPHLTERLAPTPATADRPEAP
jgi:thymidylate kinase